MLLLNVYIFIDDYWFISYLYVYIFMLIISLLFNTRFGNLHNFLILFSKIVELLMLNLFCFNINVFIVTR